MLCIITQDNLIELRLINAYQVVERELSVFFKNGYVQGM